METDMEFINRIRRGGTSKDFVRLVKLAETAALIGEHGLQLDPPDWQSPQGWDTWAVDHYTGGEVSRVTNIDLSEAVRAVAAKIGEWKS